MNNLSWGRLTAASVDAARHWLRFMADLWMSAAHGSEEASASYENVLTVLAGLTGRMDAQSTEVAQVGAAFQSLARDLTGLDSNPVNISCQLKDEHGKKLKLGWYGAWTAGRYVSLSWEPWNYPTVFLEWDTGTGEESSFLSLPSAAQQWAAKDSDAALAPLINHLRSAAESLGADVSDIPERGYEGVRKARRALDLLVQQAIADATAAAGEAGFGLFVEQ